MGLALVLGGAIVGNLTRLDSTTVTVVDFLLVYYKDFAWPAFNIADSAISIGVALIIFDSIFLERKRRQAASS